jgi:hypothetical protein
VVVTVRGIIVPLAPLRVILLGICSVRVYASPPLCYQPIYRDEAFGKVGTRKTRGIRERGGDNSRQVGRVQTEI